MAKVVNGSAAVVDDVGCARRGRVSDVPQEDGSHGDDVIWYNVKASIVQIQRWPEIKKGYFSLAAYILFVILFVVIVSLQVADSSSARAANAAKKNVPRAYEIDSSLRDGVVMESLQVDTIKTQRQLWKVGIAFEEGRSECVVSAGDGE